MLNFVNGELCTTLDSVSVFLKVVTVYIFMMCLTLCLSLVLQLPVYNECICIKMNLMNSFTNPVSC